MFFMLKGFESIFQGQLLDITIKEKKIEYIETNGTPELSMKSKYRMNFLKMS